MRNRRGEVGLGSLVAIIGVVVFLMLVPTAMMLLGNTTSTLPGADNASELGASYIIFNTGIGMTCAKNGTTSKIDFMASNTSSVFQDAIDAIPIGGMVYVSSGTYEFLYTVNITGKNGFILRGNGPQSILKMADNANCNILYIRLSHNTVIENLAFDGNHANNIAGNCIEQSSGINNAYYDLLIHDSPDRGLYVHSDLPSYACSVVNIQDCYFGGNTNEAIQAWVVGDIHIVDSVTEATQTIGKSTIKMDGCRGNIVGNYAEITIPGTFAMNLSTCSTLTVTGGTWYGPMSLSGCTGVALDNLFSSVGASSSYNIFINGSTNTEISGGYFDKDPSLSIVGSPITHCRNVYNFLTDREYGAYLPYVDNVTVAHGLDGTPVHISLTWSNPCTDGWYIDGVNATSFTIHRSTATGAVYCTWHAVVYP